MVAGVPTNNSYVDPQGVSPLVPASVKKAAKGAVSFGTKELASVALEKWYDSKRPTRTCITTMQPYMSVSIKRKLILLWLKELLKQKRKPPTASA